MVLTNSSRGEGVPDVNVVIISPSHEQPSGERQTAAREHARFPLVVVDGYLLVAPDVEQSACLVIGCRGEHVPARVELRANGVRTDTSLFYDRLKVFF